MTRVLITGPTGFLGGHCLTRLALCCMDARCGCVEPSPCWGHTIRTYSGRHRSTCAAMVEVICAAWTGRPDGYAKAATPVTSAQV